MLVHELASRVAAPAHATAGAALGNHVVAPLNFEPLGPHAQALAPFPSTYRLHMIAATLDGSLRFENTCQVKVVIFEEWVEPSNLVALRALVLGVDSLALARLPSIIVPVDGTHSLLVLR